MVDPYIAGKPAEDRRQLEIGAAVQRGGVEVPVAITLPLSRVELVLDIEKPVACPRGHHNHGQIHLQHRTGPEGQARNAKDGEQCKIEAKDAAARITNI